MSSNCPPSTSWSSLRCGTRSTERTRRTTTLTAVATTFSLLSLSSWSSSTLLLPAVRGFSCPPLVVVAPRRPPSSSSRRAAAAAIDDDDDVAVALLREHGYGRRLVTLCFDDGNDEKGTNVDDVVVEVRTGGCDRVGTIEGLNRPLRPSEGAPPPSLRVRLWREDEEDDEDDDVVVVDVGQITTIWTTPSGTDEPTELVVAARRDDAPPSRRRRRRRRRRSAVVGRDERVLEALWRDRVGRGRSGALSKKRANALSDDARVRAALRAAVGTGARGARAVDSRDAAAVLSGNVVDDDARAAAAAALAADAADGGRFRRAPCATASVRPGTITVLNGGWAVVDADERAGAEARATASRVDGPRTAADERVLTDAERLAMGATPPTTAAARTLAAAGLPATPEGARTLLVRLGRWSETAQKRAEPWSEEVLEAARALNERERRRRRELYRRCVELKDDDNDDDGLREGRVDLTALPSVCADAVGTAFRDDALGARPRAATGREVLPGGSRWEILIHVADVTDLYDPDVSDPRLVALRDAARRRGLSRYDLPNGPLHLLPPKALEALRLEPLRRNKKKNDERDDRVVNRCVTVWAYLRADDGELLDAGVERTLVRPPAALTYDEATDLLDGRSSDGGDDDDSVPWLRTAAPLLAVVDRETRLWDGRRRSRGDAAAAARETRLDARDRVAELTGTSSSFRRTRAHKLVDRALDLYGTVLRRELRRRGIPYPRASGGAAARVGTAPLRRHVDGAAQYQAAASLSGRRPRTKRECAALSRAADEASAAANAVRGPDGRGRAALRALARHLASAEHDVVVVEAVATGRENEVAIAGTTPPATARCRGVDGSLRTGQRVRVRVLRVDPDKGVLRLRLHHDDDDDDDKRKKENAT